MDEDKRIALLKRDPTASASASGSSGPVIGSTTAVQFSGEIDERLKLNKVLVTVIAEIEALPEAFFFRDLPNSVAFPHYTEMIANPVSLRQISNTAKKGKYASLEMLEADFAVMADNAADFNGPTSFVAVQGTFLKGELQSALRRMFCSECGAHCPKSVPLECCNTVRCAACGDSGICNCLLIRRMETIMKRLEEATTLHGKDGADNLKQAIQSMPPHDTSLMVQILSEEFPGLFDKAVEVGDTVEVELTPSVCERLKSIFI